MADKINKGRHNAPHGEGHHRSKLSDDQVHAIRLDRRRLIDIASDYGIVKNTVSSIRNDKTWKHI